MIGHQNDNACVNIAYMSPFQTNLKVIKPEIMCPGNLVKARDFQ
jgi:hypothetical protein